MIPNDRKDQLLRWTGIYYDDGYTLSEAMKTMEITTKEEASLVCALWGETDIEKINQALGFT